MRLIDIRNHAVATIDTCDKEPIHIPGTVQPWGYLLATARSHGLVTHCSANIARLLGRPPEQVLGHPLTDLFTGQQAAIAAFMDTPHQPDQTLMLEYAGQYLHLSTCTTPTGHLLELEPVGDLAHPLSVPISEVNQLLGMSRHPEGIQALCQSVAAYVKQKLAYDRVLVYRFHADLSGEVFAESPEDDMEPYLGLRYPASDIPPQARELYLKNLLRVIPDVHYEPVSLLTHDGVPSEHHALDLSHAVLRGVSPIHIQYLKNLRAGATATISILKDGQLWGMISCHHRTPHPLSPTQRQAARLCGLLLGSQLEVHQRAESLGLIAQTDQFMEELLCQLQEPDWRPEAFVQQDAMRRITGATGVVLRLGDEIHHAGLVPPPDALHTLTEALRPPSGNQLVTQALADLVPALAGIAQVAAGAVYQSLEQGSNCIIWLRPSLEHTVHWAGNPDKAVSRDAVTNQLMPRTSFAAWRQTVRGTSDAWHPYQTNAAGLLASALQRHLHLAALKQQEENQRLLARQLKATNEELEDINWIGIHDLREPLRKIQALVSRLIEDEDTILADAVADTLRRIERSAHKMQSLLDDVMQYARLSGTDEHGKADEAVDMAFLTREIAAGYADEATALEASLQIDSLPVIRGASFQIKQLLGNLIGNALKFARPGVPPVVRLSFKPDAGPPAHAPLDTAQRYFGLEVADNGRGFAKEYNELIFKLFQRLDISVQGTGMGLAICKKIMDNHDGWIDVESEPGHGTIFRLYFPQHRLLH